MTKQFNPHSIYKSGSNYVFDCAMISSCQPIFDNCNSNYDVERVLRKARVIRDQDRTDTETCALVVLFKTRKAGQGFITRLNHYLQKQEGPAPKIYVDAWGEVPQTISTKRIGEY